MSTPLNERGDVRKIMDRATLVLACEYLVGTNYLDTTPHIIVLSVHRNVNCEEVRQMLYNNVPREMLHFKVQEYEVPGFDHKAVVVKPDEFVFKSLVRNPVKRALKGE